MDEQQKQNASAGLIVIALVALGITSWFSKDWFYLGFGGAFVIGYATRKKD